MSEKVNKGFWGVGWAEEQLSLPVSTYEEVKVLKENAAQVC